MSLKKQITELETKLKALNFRIKRCDEILQKGEKAAVERQRDSIQAIVSTINILKGSIEEAKLGQGENEDDCRELTLSMINFAQSVKYSTYNYIEPKRIELHLHWDNWDIQDING